MGVCCVCGEELIGGFEDSNGLCVKCLSMFSPDYVDMMFYGS